MLIDLVGILILNLILIINIYLLNDKKIELRDKKIYICLVSLNLISILNLSLDIRVIKPFISYFGYIFSVYYFAKFDLVNTIVSSILIYMMHILLEIIIIIMYILLSSFLSYTNIGDIIDYMNDNIYVSLIYTIVISILSIYIFSNKYIKKIYNVLINLIRKIDLKKILSATLIVFLIVSLTYTILCYSDNMILTLIMLLILLILIIYSFFTDLNIRGEYKEAKEKYNSTQESLLEYEDMIDKYRVNNHENKNQLLTIQNMIKNKDKKVNEYIDDLVGNIYMTNEKIMMDVSIIPAGGLRATIHTKLNIMDDKKIKYILNIDRKIRTVDFDNISSELNLKICKIISIFIDNAIDEVLTHKKDKIVNIEMYIEDVKLIIEVTNKFENTFDVSKIFDKKYTTKSNGHGYGLSLAKELIESENQLNNSNKIEDDIFTQVLEIELKK